ncbi:hypothetical protein BDW75DRAFT_212546, partial [Aspergillus navahoensis]
MIQHSSSKGHDLGYLPTVQSHYFFQRVPWAARPSLLDWACGPRSAMAIFLAPALPLILIAAPYH